MRELERDLPATQPAPSDATKPRLLIVGAGRAGAAIAAAARSAGLDVAVAGRDDATTLAAEADIALLCVPDSAIAEAAAALAKADPVPTMVGHVSGAGGLDLLDVAVAAGAAAFALHPLQTMPDAETDLRGAPAAIAGADPDALATARELAEVLGMEPFELSDDARAAYHAAAVMSSNFLVALEESAAALLQRAGVESARETLAPLVLRSAANWADHGAAALTGPIARGDEATVARHLDALRELAPELLELYEAHAARTRAIAEENS